MEKKKRLRNGDGCKRGESWKERGKQRGQDGEKKSEKQFFFVERCWMGERKER